MREEIGQAQRLVPHCAKAEDVVVPDLGGFVTNTAQLPSFTKAAPKQAPPLPPQAIGHRQIVDPLACAHAVPVIPQAAKSALFVVMSSLMPAPSVPDHLCERRAFRLPA